MVMLPYIMEQVTKSSEEYNEFMKEYRKQHECCPKCNGKAHSSTLVGYIVNMDKKEEYQDKNRCICLHCGDVHSTHDRIPDIPEINLDLVTKIIDSEILSIKHDVKIDELRSINIIPKHLRREVYKALKNELENGNKTI